nr:MAG TPA: hypothetical protein [Caudoviricetes sp.]
MFPCFFLLIYKYFFNSTNCLTNLNYYTDFVVACLKMYYLINLFVDCIYSIVY